MKLPNGYGCITKMSGNRRRPFIVKEGRSGHQHVIGYAATKEEALLLLAEYNKRPYDTADRKATVSDVYEILMQTPPERMGKKTRENHHASWNHIASLAGIRYAELKTFQMQETIDSCPLSVSTKSSIKTLWSALDRIAYDREIILVKHSEALEVPPKELTTRGAFTDEEIQIVKAHAGDPIADLCLLLLYSGFRIAEAYQLDRSRIDLEAMTMCAGVKSAAGKNRIVPIHPDALPALLRLTERYNGTVRPCCRALINNRWNEYFQPLGITRTIHETRHTFETRLDAAGANRVCLDRLMGHASASTGERVYTHKTIDELRQTIMLLRL